MNKIILIVLISSFTFLSCKKPPVPSQVQNTAVESKAEVDFHPQYIDFVYMVTKSKVEYSDGGNSDQFALSIRAKKDSVIWLTAGKAGIEGVRGLVRPDSVFIMDKLKDTLYIYDIKYLQELTQSNLSYANIQNLLTGNLMFPYQEKDLVTKNETHYILQQKQDNMHIESRIRFDNMRVEQTTIVDSTSMSRTAIVYSNYIVADSILVPSVCSVDISFNKNNQKADRKVVITH